jgi:uncharacterized protein YyaL (SSP411 family)
VVNRLSRATSPYLLQHADNPVDWWEWSDESLAESRRRDRPIMLSVGYAACHWCHVMAHESFEDPATAAYLNEHFVNVKVDREERPDIDAVYMQATQTMTGQGGWPMTCVLTPDGRPFFAGTYFPPEPRHGSPGFLQLLQALTQAWDERRDDVLTVGQDVLTHLNAQIDLSGGLPTAEDLDASARKLSGQFDEAAAGFGGSPKFPPSMVLEFLLRHAAGTDSGRAIEMVSRTGEAMARGGIYDQLGGGFARYSVDRFWTVPHFEKMLYDNALLLRVYLHWWRLTGDPLAERVARETGRFIIDELGTPEGGFASAVDADSDGREGTYYVWNPDQLTRELGEQDGAWAATLLGVTTAGTFEHGFSTLQMPADPDDAARWQRIRTRLLAARTLRTKPARDDKVVASWNGLAVTALAEAGILLDEPDFRAAAVGAARLLSAVHLADRLVRTSRNGVASANLGVLEDHGAVAECFLAVLGLTGDPMWLDRARLLLDRVLNHFTDPAGGFFDTADDAETLLLRPKDVSDNAYPSGSSAAAAALLAFGAVTGEHRYREAAESGLASAAALAQQAPRFAGWTLASAEALLAGPLEVAVVGPEAERVDLHRAGLGLTSPGAVVVAGDVGTAVPLLEQRGLVDGSAAAYLCRGFVCQRPVTTADELRQAARAV